MATPRRVVIVGAGAAGIAAAIEAARAEVATTVIEASSVPGGALAASGGGCCIVGSDFQKSHGIRDSVDLAMEDWIDVGGPDADAAWARRYLSESAVEVDAWLTELGVRWRELKQYEGNSVPRMHVPLDGGDGLAARLYECARTLPIEWSFSSEMRTLSLDEDCRAAGVGVVGPDGSERFVPCDAVILATGGFCNNRKLLSMALGDRASHSRILLGGAVGSRGIGWEALSTISAAFTHLEHISLYPRGTPDPADPTGDRGMVVDGPGNAIYVNAGGHRFCNEGINEAIHRTDSVTTALMAQEPRTAWMIFDQLGHAQVTIADARYRRHGKPVREEINRMLATSPYIYSADSVLELAAKAKIPYSAIARTLADYNDAILKGGGDAFGRAVQGLETIASPPFLAVQLFPLARKNLGGVVTDDHCRVIGLDGSVIWGLYAAGEVAGMAGGHMNGRSGLEGTMIGPSLFAGRIAARAVANDLQL
jgi:succinate dehydrogenase/fumarate reductase flavoprotein subunit